MPRIRAQDLKTVLEHLQLEPLSREIRYFRLNDCNRCIFSFFWPNQLLGPQPTGLEDGGIERSNHHNRRALKVWYLHASATITYRRKTPFLYAQKKKVSVFCHTFP